MNRIAVLSDVHGNAPALAAVLVEVEQAGVDVIVFGGDLTWGPLPRETFELVRGLDARFVRGNADRAVLENVSETGREQWMQAHHDGELREFLASFEEQLVLDVDGLGAVRFCHGSPRTDEECVTPETPEERVREFSAGVDERVIVTAHVHIQFDREVAGIRSVNAGSVGLPYEGRPGAYWALLGCEERARGQSPHALQRAPQAVPLVDLRRTEYDLDATIERYRASGQPGVEQIVEMMVEPPEPREVIDHAEQVVFAG